MGKITFSLIKADVGGWPGHSKVHPELIKTAEEELAKEKGKLLIDYHVTSVCARFYGIDVLAIGRNNLCNLF